MEMVDAKGHVDVYMVSPSGERIPVASGSNTLLYRCADAVSHIFAGAVDYIPTTIGFVCTPSGTSVPEGSFGFTPNDRTTKDQDSMISSPLSVRDVQIGQNKQFSKTDTATEPTEDGGGYQGNKVTFGAMLTPQDGTSSDSAEDVYGFLLKDASGRVLAVKKLDTKVTRTKNYAVAASWSVTFK